MTKSAGKLHFLIRHQEPYIFLGLWLWLAIFNVLGGKDYTWPTYFHAIAAVAVTQLPGLLFAYFRVRLKTTLSSRKYNGYWGLCFLICLPAITFGTALSVADNNDAMFLAVGGMSSFVLEIILNVNSFYQQKVQHKKWVQKLGLESSVLITLVLIALTLSAMAISSMDNPTYHTKERQLIGFEFNFLKIITHCWTFLSIFAQFLVMYLCGYLFFYINSRFLVSKVLKQKGLVIYILSLLATIVFFYPMAAQVILWLPINKIFGGEIFSSNPFIAENAFAALAIMLLSLPIVLSLQWAKQNTTIVSLEKEKSRTELNLLKQQLNPHFFFNTLNNLYALSITKSEKTSESILQLSELMRYTIYKGQEETVTLSQELKYIDDYIQLQQIRLQKPLNFSFTKEISNDEQVLPPLLLIVFIENAFKHGIEPAEREAFLKLHIKCDAQSLNFSCQNSFEDENIGKPAGIGLENLRKRLMLLYPNRHALTIESQNHIFKAELTINLA